MMEAALTVKNKKIKKWVFFKRSAWFFLFSLLGICPAFGQTEDLMEGQPSVEELHQDIKDLTETIGRMQKRIEHLEKTQSMRPSSPSTLTEAVEVPENRNSFTSSQDTASPPRHLEGEARSASASVKSLPKSNEPSGIEPSNSTTRVASEKEEKRLESDLKKAKLRWVKGEMPRGIDDNNPETLKPLAKKELAQKRNSSETEGQTDSESVIAEKYAKARAAMAEGNALKAKKFFQPLTEKGNHSFYTESLYWMGVILLVDDHRPKEAAAYLSRAYQECLKTKEEKPLIFRQSVLLKLVEALLETGQKKNAGLILKKFFELDDEKFKLSSTELNAYKKLHKKALSFKQKLQ